MQACYENFQKERKTPKFYAFPYFLSEITSKYSMVIFIFRIFTHLY